MSWKQTNTDKTTVFGVANIARVNLPYLVANTRRKDADMTSTSAYYPGLAGTTLVIEQGGDYSGTNTITFTTDLYSTALSTINAVAPTHFKSTDYEGYLGITSLHSGNNNYIKITGGTSLSVLGLTAYPHPESISYAGEIDSPKPSIYEARSKGTAVAIKNEGINRENWNRGLAAVSSILDLTKANLDREVAFPVVYTTSITGTSFSISSDDRLFIQAESINSANPTSVDLEKVCSVTDLNGNLVFDSTGSRVVVNSITYGTLVDATQSFAVWSTADGRSVFGNLAHRQKVKVTAVITSLSGNTVKCTGANFITKKVQVNDVLKVTGATNLSPFSHNGEFIVDAVLSEDVIQIRSKGELEGVLTTGQTPACLNTFKNTGEAYGSVTIYVGSFIPLSLPMVFNLSASLPAASYKVTLPIGRTLKSILREDTTASTVSKPSGGQIEVGSKLFTTLANALKPRIIAKPNNDTTKTLLAEFKNGTIGSRIYTLKAGGMELVYNGVWDGTSYIKEDMTKETIIIGEDALAVFLGTTDTNVIIDWVNGIVKTTMFTNFVVNDGTLDVLTVPKYDGTIASQVVSKAGIKLGTQFSSDAQHLIEKINYKANSTTGKYTLLSETTLTDSRKREYVLADGTAVSTINAKWDGTQWVKDVISKYAVKYVQDIDTFKKYVNTSLVLASFSDTDWMYSDGLRNFQFAEDFLKKDSTITAAGTIVGSYFSLVTNSNLQWDSAADGASLGVGEIIGLGTAMPIGSAVLKAASMYVDSAADFTFVARCRAIAKAGLDVVSNGGFYVGNEGSFPAEALKIKTGSDVSTWYVQIGATSLNTGVANTDTYITVKFTQKANILYTFVNGVLFDTRATPYTTSWRFVPQITVSKLAAFTGQLVALDYVKLKIESLLE